MLKKNLYTLFSLLLLIPLTGIFDSNEVKADDKYSLSCPAFELSYIKDDGTFDDYLIENIFSNYHRLSDDELYNYTQKTGHKYCIDCGCEITLQSDRCISCNAKMQRMVERPTRKELKDLIRTLPFTQIAKKYNVSDNAIRKWCDAEKLPRKTSEIKKFSKEEWELL